MRRRDGWPALLAAFLAERQDMPFAWGGNDCVTFSVAWVARLTGRTLIAVDWSDARGALQALERAGGMRQAWTDKLGRPSQNWREARRGDVGLAEVEGRECGVICTGATWAGPDLAGLQHLPLSAAALVWNIG